MPEAYNFTGYRAEDVLRYRNGVNIIDMKYPFFLIEGVTDVLNPQGTYDAVKDKVDPQQVLILKLLHISEGTSCRG
jgi:hypothetical protein